MRYFKLATFILGLGLVSSSARALTAVAWVSGHGSDVVTCGPVATPCRTLQYAHDNIVAAGGQIDVLDAAGYGPLVITKALIVNNDGVGAAVIHVSSGAAITINANVNDQIVLRGLALDGSNYSAATGIQFNTGNSLRIEKSNIVEFKAGINFAPSGGAFSELVIANSNLSNMGGNHVTIRPTGANSAGAIFSNTTFGISGGSAVSLDASANTSGASVNMSDCVLDLNPNAIVVTGTNNLSYASIAIFHTSIALTNNALTANGANANITLDLSSISRVGVVAVVTSGGAVKSYGNNGIDSYTTLGPLTLTALQ